MAASISTSEFTFPSWDGTSTIHGMLWQPTGTKPRAIVQLIHGMSEHIERYDAFARYLCSHGFVVCGHDHIGHGHSVSSHDELGHMPIEDGATVLVEDADTTRYIVSHAMGEDIPYFMFGHSMGSFVLRVYLTRHGEGVTGAILCGTGQQPLGLSIAGNLLAKLGAHVRGERQRSNFIHSMADGAFSRAIDNPRTEYDWISVDIDNVDAYMADELNGFPFTLGGYAALTELTLYAADAETASLVPPELPLLFIAGAEDPVGQNGAGVISAAEMMSSVGVRNVNVIIYEGMRHEILNESDSDIVFSDVLSWLNAVLDAQNAK